jgi:pyruvate kinase
MPTEAATDAGLIRALLTAGMDVMRINCARDHREAWEAMIRHLRAAEKEVGRSCRIWMDLAGPKLRTGRIDAGPGVVKIRPKRNAHGEVVMPARVWLTPMDAAQPPPDRADAVIPIDDELVAKSHAGDILTFNDTRDRTRMLEIVQEVGASRWATSEQTAYLQSNSVVDLCFWDGTVIAGRVGSIAEAEAPVVLKVGETISLTPHGKAGRAAEYGSDGELVTPARVPVLLAEAFRDVRVSERIFFDDGRIGGVIREATPDQITVEIVHAREQGSKLRSYRGINLPDSRLSLPALTERDRADLDFVVEYADMVSLSFVRRPDDVLELQRELARRGASQVGILIKIETGAAFKNLPRLLLAGLRWSPLGVVVARGDLSVEIGFDRLAEVQEEILWLCESAHVPVIWATQVLETLTRTGLPSRAEVTDAAMSARAECVMLNKGTHIVEALKFLTNVLQRMQAHHSKKRSMLRKLSIADLE